MDREQEDMQFLGLFGIYREAYKVIISWRKIFSQITLALILPLSFIFLAHIEVSQLLFSRIRRSQWELNLTRAVTHKNNKRLSDHIFSEWTLYWLFRVLYYIFLLIFSLLSTSAVVYTIASIYTGRDVTFKKVMSVVPKVWKRLMVTFMCIVLAFFLYNGVAMLILFLWAITIWDTKASVPTSIIMLILYIVGFVYMTVIWQLASVVSVLEDLYGFKAMAKSKRLVKGKMVVAIVTFFILNFSLAVIQVLFNMHIAHGRRYMWEHLLIGLLCFLLLFKLILFGLVVQTIIYFVCKSYHHENIDKSALSNHLEVYLGEYIPLKAKDVQLEQYDRV